MSASGGVGEPFLNHLVAVLSIYELGAYPAPVPRYDGPHDWHTETILRSLSAIVKRLDVAEETVKSLKMAESWPVSADTAHPKKRRSIEMEDRNHLISSNNKPPPFNRALSSTATESTYVSSSLSNGSSSSAGSDLRNRHPSPDSSSTDFEMSDSSSESEATPLRQRPPFPNGLALSGAGENRSPSALAMAISLDGLKGSIDPSKMFNRSLAPNAEPTSAPATSAIEHVVCPTCGCKVNDGYPLPLNGIFSSAPEGSPLVVPPGPLATAAFESGMSAMEELRLLKTQVQDVSRVCQAVARGDLSQKITVPVQGVVMVQLKDVINSMVSMT